MHVSRGQGLALLACSVGLVVLAGCGHSHHVARLGCHQYCQQAGGYGGGGPPVPKLMRIVTTGTVAALKDGTVPIELSCVFARPCSGALLLNSVSTGPTQAIDVQGRSDLLVAAHGTRTIGVLLSPGSLGLLRAGRVKVSVTADSGQTVSPLPVSQRLKLDPVTQKDIFLSAPGS